MAVSSPLPGRLTVFMSKEDDRQDFLKSDEYNQASKVLPFCRVWCIGMTFPLSCKQAFSTVLCAVEMSAALRYHKTVIFRCTKAKVNHDSAGIRRVTIDNSNGGEFLQNCSFLVDVEKAECAVPEDKRRELAKILDKATVNREVSAAINAGVLTIDSDVAEVDAYLCGEAEALRQVAQDRVQACVEAAAASGHLGALAELLVRLDSGKNLDHSIWVAAKTGHAEALAALLDTGIDLNKKKVSFPHIQTLV